MEIDDFNGRRMGNGDIAKQKTIQIVPIVLFVLILLRIDVIVNMQTDEEERL